MTTNPRTTILIPTEVLEEVKQRAKKARSNINDWTVFALLSSLQDKNFSSKLNQHTKHGDQTN